ncbi:MAG TPA: ATP-dependent protease ATPase subunit HslU [Spirochaetota bacterium]|nr:ATP-dependent protease ATPase subunit HslU [Spirochaetota bacterium]HPH03409.1 ATP-dependent protease ATPase subunit HslU [Spirochaetota bacterium]
MNSNPLITGMTPQEIVSELDKYIMGQDDAKRAVAVAVRNRSRRMAVDPAMRDEILPKNILMVGPTGVGKTEIARRMAQLVKAPFIKVEATKYTEVGYVGRDVESMIRDLVTSAVNMVRREQVETNRVQAEKLAEEALLQILLPSPPGIQPDPSQDPAQDGSDPLAHAREKMRAKLRSGELDERIVEINLVQPQGSAEIFVGSGVEEIDVGLQNMISSMLPQKSKLRRVAVREAKGLLIQQEAEKMLDMDSVASEAVRRVEQNGVVFIDEIDKISGRESGHGPDVSREGVQRDILPIVEGSTVNTRFGPVRTDHILFIAAGAFHVSRPDDLIPELQGRFPIRVTLQSLRHEDFKRILTKPKNALIKQYEALLATEGVHLKFEAAAIDELARVAEECNRVSENIGARRLHTLLEQLLSEILYSASEKAGEKIVVTREYLKQRLHDTVRVNDLGGYIL